MNVYELVSQKIISQLEKGVTPWRKPWITFDRDSLAHRAFNRFTRKPYSFLNQLLLGRAGEWASFNQWKQIGGNVKKGEKGSLCVFFKLLPRNSKEVSDDERKDENAMLKFIPVLRYYTVFHISQVDGVQPLDLNSEAETSLSSLADFSPVEAVEKAITDFLDREHISISYGGSTACYIPAFDSISLPPRKAFDGNAAEYYSTLLHECGHATGAKNRLDRFSAHTTPQQYAREELVAELFAAAMLNTFGVETPESFQNSAAYIQNWLAALQNDSKLIVVACQRAEKAAQFFLGETSVNAQPQEQAA